MRTAAEQCYRWTCSEQPACDPTILIQNDLFVGCSAEADGGAVYISRTGVFFTLLDTEFRGCSATGGKSGGAVYFGGGSVLVSGFTGSDCVAHAEAFCRLRIASPATGVVEINDSYAFHGICGSNIFLTECADGASGSTEVLCRLNFTANYADQCASAIWIGLHFALRLQFCRFCSNAPRSVLSIRGTAEPDLVNCLEIFDNRVVTADSDTHGLLNIYESFTIEGCVFYANQFDFLVGGGNECTLKLMQCVLDSQDAYGTSAATDGIVLQVESCTIQASGAITLPPQCQADVPPPDMSSSADEPITSAPEPITSGPAPVTSGPDPDVDGSESLSAPQPSVTVAASSSVDLPALASETGAPTSSGNAPGPYATQTISPGAPVATTPT
jgi:hypothetical protein